MKDRFSNPIYRVDDRLLHGSVVIGWGETLPIGEFILADDEVSRDELVRELCLTCVPPEKKVSVLSLSEAGEQLQKATPAGLTMVVLRGCADAANLHRAGVAIKQLNLGGIHFRDSSNELLPYIFLTPEDRQHLSYLRDAGVEIYCCDLPDNKRYPLEELLDD